MALISLYFGIGRRINISAVQCLVIIIPIMVINIFKEGNVTLICDHFLGKKFTKRFWA